MALAIWSGSSSIRTMSAASMAASLPIAPIAMPMSARVRTGASLMPSPTNASLPFVLLAASSALAASGEKIGSVDTAFQWLGRDHDIVVEAYDDPQVEGVTCYVSRARIGGIKGTLGLAEDRAEASIACRQVGPVAFAKPIKQQDEIFSERISLVFKRLRVVRMVDEKRNTLVYLTYSDKLIDGSPQNSITAVPIPEATPIPLKK